MVQRYTREIITQVLSAVDIVDVISARIELKPSGSNRYKALSPFSNEKTPSFMVSRDRQMYHCFSSGKGGDAIRFLMEFEGLTFSEALRKLADSAGIRLSAPTEQDDREEYMRAQLLELGKFAAEFFRRQFTDATRGAQARAYLEKRKLNSETAAKFMVGFGPNDWSALYDAAVKRQFRDYVIEASGLCRRGDRGDRGLYDFFRNRLIFPIRDVSGNMVAFGGRDLSGESPAKYVNSPETPVYKKSRVLYGLYEGRDALRNEKFAIVVEGYIDLLRCADAGFKNVVATCGTALTEQQAALIRRYVGEVVLVYDGDTAGIKAALRGTGVLTAAGLHVRAMALPGGKDPDDFIRDDGAEAFAGLLAAAPDFVSFYVNMSAARVGTIEGQTEVARELFQILRGVNDTMLTDAYLKKIAKALDIHEWACRREFEQFRREADRRDESRAARAPEARTPDDARPVKDAVDFIAALLLYPELRRIAGGALADMRLPDTPVAEVLQWVLALDGDAPPRASAQDFGNEAACALYSAAAVVESMGEPHARAIVGGMANRLLRDALTAEGRRINEEIRRAQRDKDAEGLRELTREQMELMKRLHALKPN